MSDMAGTQDLASKVLPRQLNIPQDKVGVRSQTPKDTRCPMPSMMKRPEQAYVEAERLVATRGRGREGEEWAVTADGCGISSWGEARVLEAGRGDGRAALRIH